MKRIYVLLTILVFGFVSCSIENFEEGYNVYDDGFAIKNNADKVFQQKSVGNNYKEIYSQKVTGTFTGLKTIRTLNNNGSITFDITLKINSGNVKLVLVGERKDEFILVCEQNVSKIFSFDGLQSSKYKLKLVGDSATFELDMKF